MSGSKGIIKDTMSKKFKHIKFKKHNMVANAYHGELQFKNGYVLSVIYGGIFSEDDPKHPYEIGLKYDEKLTIIPTVGDSVKSNLDQDRVEFYMDIIEKMEDPKTNKNKPF